MGRGASRIISLRGRSSAEDEGRRKPSLVSYKTTSTKQREFIDEEEEEEAHNQVADQVKAVVASSNISSLKQSQADCNKSTVCNCCSSLTTSSSSLYGNKCCCSTNPANRGIFKPFEAQTINQRSSKFEREKISLSTAASPILSSSSADLSCSSSSASPKQRTLINRSNVATEKQNKFNSKACKANNSIINYNNRDNGNICRSSRQQQQQCSTKPAQHVPDLFPLARLPAASGPSANYSSILSAGANSKGLDGNKPSNCAAGCFVLNLSSPVVAGQANTHKLDPNIKCCEREALCDVKQQYKLERQSEPKPYVTSLYVRQQQQPNSQLQQLNLQPSNLETQCARINYLTTKSQIDDHQRKENFEEANKQQQSCKFVPSSKGAECDEKQTNAKQKPFANNNKQEVLDWKNLAQLYRKMPRQQNRSQFWWKARQSCLCQMFIQTILGMFPILTSFKHYTLPGDLLTDLVAGFTIAVLHIPQGMAYGLLAGVEAIHGLYVSFVPVLVMALMSKSRHVSYGTFAVISMLLASATDSIKQNLQQQMVASMAAAAAAAGSTKTVKSIKEPLAEQNGGAGGGFVVTNNHKPLEMSQQVLRSFIPSINQLDDTNDFQAAQISSDANLNAWPGMIAGDFVMPSNIEILTSICILVGLIQTLMALMRLGVLSLMFSDQLVSSFTTASAIHVVTSQLGPLFDLSLPPVSGGIFKVCRTWWIFGVKLLDDFNQYTAILTFCSVAFLLFIKEVIEPAVRKRFKSFTCLPSELILMAVAITSSWYWNFNDNYNVRIIGHVPTGLPELQVPRIDLFPLILQDAFTIASVSFAMNLSLGQVYAKRFRYKLNPNQELFALGTSNFVSSFFSCFPCASSLSRSAVQSNLNAKSQLCSLFSCAIVVSIICYFAPILHDLPRSTLSCIIIVALKGILVQITDLYANWRLSKLDAVVWMLTFISVLAFGVTYGLVLGIIASLFMIFFRLLTPNHSILGQLPGTDIYIDKTAFIDCVEVNQVKIFRFNSALCYLNRTMFKSSVEKSLPSVYGQSTFSLFCSKRQQFYNSDDDDNKIKFLIIDCSALAYCDYSGAATLVEIIEELDERKITVYLAACPLKLISMFEKIQKSKVLEQNVYASITDAVNHTKFLKSYSHSPISTSSISDYDSTDASCLHSVLSP